MITFVSVDNFVEKKVDSKLFKHSGQFKVHLMYTCTRIEYFIIMLNNAMMLDLVNFQIYYLIL